MTDQIIRHGPEVPIQVVMELMNGKLEIVTKLRKSETSFWVWTLDRIPYGPWNNAKSDY